MSLHHSSGFVGPYMMARLTRAVSLMVERERLTVMAIMVEHEIAGVPRPNAFRNPLADKRTDNDLVNRIFTTDGPNRLWLTEFTEHSTREGKVYCCVVLDCFAPTGVYG